MRDRESYLVAGERRWLVVAVAAGLIAFVLGLLFRPVQAWSAFLVSSFFFLTVALGGLVFLAIMYVSNAGWHTVFKRVPEALTACLPASALSMLAVLAGARWLYPWAHADAVLHDELLSAKAPYLNTDFFAVRMVGVLALWLFFALMTRRYSLRQDRDADIKYTRRNVVLSAIFLALFPFSFSMASIDWLMSLEPHWASTMIGLYHIAGLLSAAVAAVSIVAILLRRRGALPQITETHLHDLGKLLFGFSTVWAYLWFSQYLLIWYTNFPEETTHYLTRLQGGGSFLFFLNVVLNWAVPFVVLLRESAKRSERILLPVSAVVLAGRWLDIHLQVVPAVVPNRLQGPVGIGILDVALLLGFGAAFLFTTDRALRKAPLVAEGDPYLVEALHQ